MLYFQQCWRSRRSRIKRSLRPCGAQIKRDDFIFHAFKCNEGHAAYRTWTVGCWLNGMRLRQREFVQNVDFVFLTLFTVREEGNAKQAQNMKFSRESISEIASSIVWRLWTWGQRTHILFLVTVNGWNRMLLCQNEEKQTEEAVEGEKGVVQNPVLEVKMKALHYTGSLGNFNSDHRPKQIGHTSVDDIAVHSWKTVLRDVDMLVCSNYRNSEVDVFLVPWHATTRWTKFIGAGVWSCVWTGYCSELNVFHASTRTKEPHLDHSFVGQSLCEEERVMKFSSMTMAMGKACLLLFEHECFLEYEKNEHCVWYALQLSVEPTTCRPHSFESDSVVNEGICDPALISIWKMDRVLTWR